MSRDQLELGLPRPEPRSEIYLASAISAVTGDGQDQVVRTSQIIKLTAEATAATMNPPWDLHVHAPCLVSSPREAPDTPPEQVFDDNSRLVCEETDALMVIGDFGGSLGAGQELTWASAVRLPVVLFQRRDQPPTSRQVRGTPIDLEIVEFGLETELIQEVVDYLYRRRHGIQTHARQRDDGLVALQPLAYALQQAWDKLDEGSRRDVVATSRLRSRRVAMLLERPGALRAASVDEVLALSGALGIDAGQYISGDALPQLSNEQIQALKTAAAEYEWSVEETLDLMTEAQLELVKGGTRRFSLATPEDWLRFRATRSR